MQAAKQAASSEPKSADVVKELLSGDLDIYSVALSNTFDEQLSQRRSERFVLNRIPKDVRKTNDKQSDDASKADTRSAEKLEKRAGEQSEERPEEKKPEVKSEAKSVNIAEKYRDSALEVYDRKEKLVTLSMESSLEFGKEQKLKDFEVEKLRLENRLTWRAIQEFDSDESSSEDEGGADAMDDAD